MQFIMIFWQSKPGKNTWVLFKKNESTRTEIKSGSEGKMVDSGYSWNVQMILQYV